MHDCFKGICIRLLHREYPPNILTMDGSTPARGLTHLQVGLLICFVVLFLTSMPMPSTAQQLLRQLQITDTSLNSRQFGAIIGVPVSHVVGPKETLLDIVRSYDLGYNEIIDLYPHYDPWLPPAGQSLALPTEHLVPDGPRGDIVINIAELRMYRYVKSNGRQDTIITYPVGIGAEDSPTPTGNFTIDSKERNPTWFIPPSLRSKYKVSSVPPGPDNPLGKYWLGLKGTKLGIHGSDTPWSIGRMVTHGCIRMYPEDIEPFFSVIKPGTKVHLIYQPVKMAYVSNRLFIEVHRDIYGIGGDPEALVRGEIEERGLDRLVDQDKLIQALESRSGAVVDITRTATPIVKIDLSPQFPDK